MEPDGETRVSIVPGSIKKLQKFGFELVVEKGAGQDANYSDSEYTESGATIGNRSDVMSCEIIISIRMPNTDELSSGQILACVADPFRHPEKVKACIDGGVTLMSMDMIPRRLSRAQSMDVNSSQDNLAGYKAVLLGAAHVPRGIPMMTTSAGTVRPAKVVIMGSGVAGLQAIATANRLGAQVEAFDVRPAVKEQVESLGAKFIEVSSDTSEGEGEGGYAKETSEEYKKLQQKLIHSHIIKANAVITTALIPGRSAPILIPSSMVEEMKPGSVIIDLAAENGGNCELTKVDETISLNGIEIDGTSNIPGTMPVHASELYSKNVAALLAYMTKDGELNLDLEDEIISGSMYTHLGEITNDSTKEALGQ